MSNLLVMPNPLFPMLSADVESMIMDYLPNPWKHRFTTDVLPCLDKGWKLVGFEEDGACCGSCYIDGEEMCGMCDPSQREMVSYSKFMLDHGLDLDIWMTYLPYDLFKHAVYKNGYDDHFLHLRFSIYEMAWKNLSVKQLVEELGQRERENNWKQSFEWIAFRDKMGYW